MRTIEDKSTGITITHNSDWSGKVLITWLSVDGAVGRREVGVSGDDLVAGRVGSLAFPVAAPMPVIVRATALAVEAYLMSRFQAAVERIGIPRVR